MLLLLKKVSRPFCSGSNCTNSECLLYADDAKLFRPIQNVTDCVKLQEDLSRLEAWCDLWKLDLNVQKCLAISFTNKRSVIDFNYCIAESFLKRENQVKDLGIILKSNLNMSSHISYIANNAFRMLGFLKRNCKHFNQVRTLKTLYLSLVRSGLEYCSVVWNPWQKSNMSTLESVQRKFVKYLCFKTNTLYHTDQYEALCSVFKFPTLEQRRFYLDMMFLHKCATGIYNLPGVLFKLNFNVPGKQLRTCPTFRPPRSRINISKYSPINRCMSSFNELLLSNPNIDLFSNHTQFKTDIRHSIFSSVPT